MSERMAEVLAAHWSASTHSNHNPIVDKCDGCGEVILRWGEGDPSSRLATHQAEALTAAGFGDVRQALRDAAQMFHHASPAAMALESRATALTKGDRS